MKEINFKCDKCKRPIVESDVYNISYGGAIEGNAIYGDNRVPCGGFHYHYACVGFVVQAIVECNEKGEQKNVTTITAS